MSERESRLKEVEEIDVRVEIMLGFISYNSNVYFFKKNQKNLKGFYGGQ